MPDDEFPTEWWEESARSRDALAEQPKKRSFWSTLLKRSKQFLAAGLIAGSLGAAYFAGQRAEFSRAQPGRASLMAERDSLQRAADELAKANGRLVQMNASLEQKLSWSNNPMLVDKYDSLSLAQSQVLSAYRILRRKNTSLADENEQLEEQQERLLQGNRYFAGVPPIGIDTLVIDEERYFVEINKEEQRLRVWKPANYVLVADVPCSTGLYEGEKERAGDYKTPSGFATIVSRQESAAWTSDGEHAYGPLFFRLNQGDWDGSGEYDPVGHCSIGIHGTHEPAYLSERRSHGCIRLWNVFLLEADRAGYLRPGNPVYIVPEDPAALAYSKHGVGVERIRNVSGNVGEGDKKMFASSSVQE
ncbi:L,D-transpeptidase [Candidatus Woesearchaeota archaeon]|nr:L,D-transpeptidase [Candidatus Woesearchaeota archaeon]